MERRGMGAIGKEERMRRRVKGGGRQASVREKTQG